MSRIEEIKARLNAATKGKWIYDKSRNTHDSCVHVEGSKEEYGYIKPDRGGVIGSSEWIWIKDADGEFIAHSKDDIEWLISQVDMVVGSRPIIDEIFAEIERAERKFPGWPEDKIHASAIVAEEVGELQQAALQYYYENGLKEKMREEAIQTAAMAIRFLKNY